MGEYYNPVFYISTGDSGLYVEAAVMMMRLCGDYLRKQTNILVCRMYGAVPARRTSFDCSGFVSYVFTNSGVCNMEDLLHREFMTFVCLYHQKKQGREILSFSLGRMMRGEPVTHVGIYAGDGQMIHCGNPIQYTSINSAYWQSHFYAFGRP